jgi:hypothetical protein
VSSRPASADPADPAAINRAIEWGVKYLKKEQKQNGYWTDDPKATWAVGYTALAGLVLVECGDPNDTALQTAIQRAARVVRSRANELDSTYELALAILFLDRMKEKSDKSTVQSDKTTIQMLAGRLIAAQMRSGGWGYKAQKLSSPDAAVLLTALRKMTPPAAPKEGAPPFDPEKARKAALANLPAGMKSLAVFESLDPQLQPDAKDKAHDLYDATTDNSNTHFAMLGLWAARKYDVPTDRTLARLNRRFRTTQGPGGTWAYHFARGGADGGNQFACVALLALAIGHVVAPEAGAKPEADPIILNAFAALSKTVGEPAGDTKNRPKIKDVGGLYFLWAMERVAVLYDLQKLGKKDWYLWGAEILVANQQGDGYWADEKAFPGETPLVNTCFALLFLRRANLTPDLSNKLSVNTSELSSKVEDKIAPKPLEPPPSSPMVEPPPSPKIEPPPPPKVEPKKEPPPPAPPVVLPSASEPVSTPAPAKKTPWLWIVLGTVLAGAVGGGLAFLAVAMRRKKDDEDEDEDDNGAKKKKKGKKKAKLKAETEEDEG